jgi:uncharacterized protein (TIGR02594 family)
MSVEKVRPAPTADPNYLGASGGPLNIRPNMAGAALFEGLANVVGAVAQGTDQVIQNNIQKDVWSMFDQEVGAQGVDSKVEEVTGFGGPPVSDAPVPQGILGQGKSFARLKQAYEEGRISDSYYYARLEAGVRQLRAKYPGYREQVDGMVSSITGVQPANALRRSLLSDIAEAERAAGSSADKFQSFVNQNMQFAGPWASELEAGRMPPEGEFRAYVAQRKTEMEDISRQKTMIEFGNLTDDQRAKTAGRVFTQEANAAVQGMIDTAWGNIQNAQAGGNDITGEGREQLRQSVAQLRATAEMTLDQLLNNPIGDTGETYATIISTDQVKKIREQQLNRIAVLSDALTNEQFGLLNLDRNVTRAMQDESLRELLNANPVFLLQQSLAQIGGAELLNNMMSRNLDFMSESVSAVTAVMAGRIATGAKTVAETIEELVQKDVKDPAVIRGVLDRTVQVILDPKSSDVVVANAVRATFGPDGNRLMAYMKDKQEFLRLFTAPAIADRINKLAEADPSLGSDYRQRLQDWFSSAHLQDITNLKGEAAQGGPLNLVRDENGRYRYELTEEGQRLPPRHPERSRAVSDPLLDRLNASLDLVENAVKRVGGSDRELDQFRRILDMRTEMGEFAPEPTERPQTLDPSEDFDAQQQRLQQNIQDRQTVIEAEREEQSLQQDQTNNERLLGETQRDMDQLNSLLAREAISQEEYDKARERLETRYNELGGDSEANFPAAESNPSAGRMNLSDTQLLSITPQEIEKQISTSGKSIVEVASNFIGVHERSGQETLSDFFQKTLGRAINPVTTPWCAAFANAVLKEKGIKGTGSLLARSFLDFGTPTETPQKGDIVVLTRGNKSWQGHVGFFMGFDDNGNVRILGGNQSNRVSVQSYNADRVIGYRQPPNVKRVSSMPSFKGTAIGDAADNMAVG